MEKETAKKVMMKKETKMKTTKPSELKQPKNKKESTVKKPKMVKKFNVLVEQDGKKKNKVVEAASFAAVEAHYKDSILKIEIAD